ncbi:glycosyltransferase family 8 protein [Artomyces pyxidatus]|uniref:Glycosyltransferase family 8 protein n=1 Tax=Artomyces pyxidatus TaxID=48021 RepID=A0ACB8TGR7_9AGAM|nr:glycosyltransferase family 8 protein [Artomyces pyxidatus]
MSQAISSNTMSDYIFTPTQDWFTFNIDTWEALFSLIESPAPRVLEIGSWEGRSAVFLLNNLCASGGEIVCIDHFDLLRTEAGRERHRKIEHNLALTGKTFRILDQFSFPALMDLLEEEMSSAAPGFDWVYVDGSHEADDTLLDGELAWRLARKGAVFIFDDYDWNAQPKESIHHPRRGIDAFLTLHKGEYRRLSSDTQYQMILQKTSEMRIGFLVKEKADLGLQNALGYGVNVVYAIDAAYAMPAAVSIRSLLKQSCGRISIYVIDCGLDEVNKEKLKQSLPIDDNFTLTFLKLPPQSLAVEKGAVWAKVDLATIVPVERVLYLDADTLIRGDVKDLWDTDLVGQPLAAAADVGYPMGHSELGRMRYFNAGVMLMDLAKIRAEHAKLELAARDMGHSQYLEQDILNVYFRDRWTELSLKWNAQGLATYAEDPSEDRNALAIEEMRDASIVHFTGPVHPDVEIVLNPWVQPYTAKPWGYAGAPSHPFAEEWWQVLEGTEWKGYRASAEFFRARKDQVDQVIARAGERLKQKLVGYSDDDL